uniref:SURF1-like protein n=1 Tax=Glossina palpalis gambiensis TaxID=67801 RepID=A0A1B0B5P6_9MUSC
MNLSVVHLLPNNDLEKFNYRHLKIGAILNSVEPYVFAGQHGYHELSPMMLTTGRYMLVNKGIVREKKEKKLKIEKVVADGCLYCDSNKSKNLFIKNDTASNTWFTLSTEEIFNELAREVYIVAGQFWQQMSCAANEAFGVCNHLVCTFLNLVDYQTNSTMTMYDSLFYTRECIVTIFIIRPVSTVGTESEEKSFFKHGLFELLKFDEDPGVEEDMLRIGQFRMMATIEKIESIWSPHIQNSTHPKSPSKNFSFSWSYWSVKPSINYNKWTYLSSVEWIVSNSLISMYRGSGKVLFF